MAASRVNVKFVVILVTVLVLGFVGMAGAYFFVVKRSPEQNIQLGDKKFDEGNFKAAEKLYAKAVNKEQTNVEWLTKWKKALEQLKPETESEFSTEYGNYVNLVRQLAVVQRTNVAAHREYLDTYSRSISQGAFDIQSNQRLLGEVNDTLKYFEEVPETQDNWAVLRRYRGQTLVRIMAEAPDQADDQNRALAKADLEAALKADPTDAESALALEDWHHVQAIAARKAERVAEADQLSKQADQVAEAFLAANPGNMAGYLSSLRRRMEVFRLQAVNQMKQAEGLTIQGRTKVTEQIRGQLATLIPDLDKLADVMKAYDPAKINIMEVLRFQAVESTIDPASRLRRTEEIASFALKGRPGDADFMMLVAALLNNRQDFKAAITQYQAVLDLPQKPVSYDGAKLFAQKLDASYQLCLAQIKIWALAAPEERDAELKKAKEYRQKLALRIPEESKEVRFVDAQLAYAQADYAQCQRLITSYNQDTRDSNPDALWLLAQTAMRLEQPGLADSTLTKLLEIRPDFYDGLVMRGDLLILQERREETLELWNSAYAIRQDENLKKKIDSLTAIVKGTSVDDPVINALIQSDRFARGDEKQGITPNPERALNVLIEGFEKTNDTRFVRPIVVKMLDSDNRDAALAIIRKGRQLKPDDKDIQQLEVIVGQPDPMLGKLQYLDLLGLPPLETALQRYGIYSTYSKQAEADAQVAEAVRLAPNDPRVIEVQFIRALQAKDVEKARQLADQAVASNADREQGLTFRARVAVLQGRLEEGISLLQQATQRGSANVETWRLLGSLQTQAGRVADASESYRKAVELRPTDISAIYEYILSLAQSGQMDEALRKAREYDRYAGSNERFIELRLVLESNASTGDKDWAIKMREQIATRKPDDFKNKLYLASLYMDKRRMPAARTLIDAARAKADDQEWASLDARWYADQGDAAGMRKVVDTFLDKTEESKRSAAPYITFGQFFIARGLPEDGFKYIDAGRKYQDPKLMEADKAIADNLARQDRKAESIPVYQRILDGGADDKDLTYAKRLTEILLVTDQPEQAEKLIAGMGARVNEDPIAMMLHADALRGIGEAAAKAGDAAKAQTFRQRAHDTYDKAVSNFPTEPLTYMKRAQVYIEQPEMVQNVLADLDAALKLRPGSWQALKLRAALYVKLDRYEEAITDLREAIKTNPTLDEIRGMLMSELIRRGRAVEAQDVATEALRRRPNDLNLLIAFGDIFRAEGQMDRAEAYYRAAWDLNKTSQITLRLLESQLNRDTPNLNGAADILKDKAVQADVDRDPALLMSRAKLLAKRGQAEAALADAQASVKLIPADRPEFILAWYGDLRRVEARPQYLLRFLEAATKAGVHPDWMQFFRAGLLCDDTATRTQGLEILEQVIERGQQQPVALLSMRLRGSTFYSAAEYDKAADAYRAGIARFPDDWEMNNNLAYTMAFHLKQPAEAIPFAQTAVRIVPNNGDAQDTYGVCLMQAGKLAEADGALTKAVANASSTKSRVSALLHLGDLRVLQKRGPEAAKIADQLDDLIRVNQTLTNYRNDVDDLRRRISSLAR
ncbi:MAG: tetratricopeptide repeat protein [Phycisphaerales bacterium]|nr:tetratricopeptide repeat protein [Phycisphaerales bacterium]